MSENPFDPLIFQLNQKFPRGFVVFGISNGGKFSVLPGYKDNSDAFGLDSFILKYGQIQDNVTDEIVANSFNEEGDQITLNDE